MKGLIVHLITLALATGLAFGVWSREEEPSKETRDQVTVWGGSPSSLTSLTFEAKNRSVRLEPRTDATGRYYIGTVEKDAAPFVHSPDAGAPPPAKRETIRFVGVKAADDFVKSLVPLRAPRAVGKLEGTRAEEFGLDKPAGTLKLVISGKPQSLVVGGLTPGGGEYYCKAGSGEIFPVAVETVQNLLFTESRLMERELHAFPITDVTRIRITKGGKSRELVRVPDKTNGWADPANPSKLDETAGNWMTKVTQLRPNDYVEKLGAAGLVFRIDYFAGTKPLGFLELFSTEGATKEYLLHTEYGRWYAKVITASGESIDKDLASVFK